MSSAKKFVTQYTREDYQHWEGDWQLLKGIAVSMSPSPAAPHERVVAKLLRVIGNFLEDQESDCEPYAGLDWIVGEHTVVRPDVMVVCGEQPEIHLEKPPVLACEVLSPATWKVDTEVKLDMYKENGVKIYLIVDTDLKTIEVNDFQSGDTTTLRGTESCSVCIAEELSLDISPEKIFR